MSVAFYMRLSLSDGDLGVNGKDESNSIENQRMLLQEYVQARNELSDDILEYADDGFTGTNFNRPAFRQMIEDAKKGLIDTILVKDLSRLGRDYITAGDYIEQIFPLLGVRFIAVNNGYDSSDHSSSAMGFDVAVNNLINTFYSRDLSKKIKAGSRTKWKQGISTSSAAPYGYVKSKTKMGNFEIDPEAAEVVRMIFREAAKGVKSRDIARMLNEKKTLTPREYLEKRNGWHSGPKVTPKDERLWDSTKVTSIIRRREYTGAAVMGKRGVRCVGSKNVYMKPQREWTVIPDVNEPIVSQEEFELANMTPVTGRRPDYIVKQKYPLKGKLRCGNCHHVLSRAVAVYKEYFYCSHGASIDLYSKCCKEQYPVAHMESIVWRALREHMLTLQNIGIQTRASVKKALNMGEERRRDIAFEIQKLKEEKIHQYEFFAEELISKDAYLRKKESLDARIQQLEAEGLEQKTSVKSANDLLQSAESILELTGLYISSEKITYEAVDAFIETIYVYDPSRVEIVYRFGDEVEQFLRQAQIMPSDDGKEQ